MPRVTAASRTDRGGTEAPLRASRYRRLRETTAGRALRTPLDPDPLLDFLGRLGAVFGGSGQFPDEWSGLRLVAVLPPLLA